MTDLAHDFLTAKQISAELIAGIIARFEQADATAQRALGEAEAILHDIKGQGNA